ncbi:MAG: DEAD/DEAH box helicase [Baekduia sp.]
MPLTGFTDATRDWFARAFDGPTEVQSLAWPAIASGDHTLISAPTGSGKTLAAFLWSLDRIAAEPSTAEPTSSAGSSAEPNSRRQPRSGCRVVYVSPLKALSYDVERNLQAPLRGIGAPATVAIRTGDTSQRERAEIRRHPPDVLITTPESLYLMLTSQAREILDAVETVIVDEIHAVASTKRGAHLALTLERLSAGVIAAGGADPQRIGLSATQNPLEEVGRFMVGPRRQCRIVDAGVRKPLDLEIVVPVESMVEPERSATREKDPLDPEAHVHVQGSEATQRSIWPAMYPKILDLVREHRSTIVFVNNRRSAERLALRLNELATGDSETPVEIARAHHGSLAREERLIIEEQLKAGQLPCLVATSSLELGIDMGAVDLVLQIESPKSVARGLQRIGRAGHGVGDTSKGRIFPKFRADLLECAVVTKLMREGRIEPTVVPRNALDVLCQQIVAIAVEYEDDESEPLAVDALFDLVTSTYSYAELPRPLLENVLDMLDGRYPSQDFAELRPRIVWDRIAGTIRPRKGARQLAVTNAGTIPDRGLYAVVLPDGRRVGELDEEMVYEARPGQVFLLGASSWRIEEIERDRVVVTPAPGAPGAVPFWRGDTVGRPKELGRELGAFSRWAVEQDEDTLASQYDLDRFAARNLLAFLREQQQETRVVPSDTAIVVERFRDEIGDWRLCVLSPFGGRVHAAWGLALSARIRDELGLESDAIWSDDGIIVHLPEADDLDLGKMTELILIEPDEVEDRVVKELGASALFGARFRENAGRALLIPRAYPGKRTPLWQQRLKSQTLLEVAREYSDFPIVLETYRECLRDVLDVPGLVELLTALHSREISLVEVETRNASPMASSLLFDYIATYMYEGDTPNAERRAAALSLNRDLLAELLGQEELRDLLDPDAVRQVEDALQHRDERLRATDADSLADVLRRVGDLSDSEVAERVLAGIDPGGLLDKLADQRRAVRVRIGGEQRWIAADDAGLYRDAFGVVPPGGLPAAYLETAPDPAERIVARYARTHGPFTGAALRTRYGVDMSAALKTREAAGKLVLGEIDPHGTSGHREYCDPDVLRRIRRASLAALRKEIEASEQRALGAFLPSWQGVDRHTAAGAGIDRLREVLVPLQGLALPADVWERDVLPRRCGAYSATWLDQLCAAGEVVWIGAGALGRSSGRVALYFREDVAQIGAPWAKAQGAAVEHAGDVHQALRACLGASPRFFTDLLADEGLMHVASPQELQEALWDLVWAGEVTNDAFAPLRAPRLTLATARQAAGGRRGTRFGSRRGSAAVPLQGRWSLTSTLLGAAEPDRRTIAELLLERYGVLTREHVVAEGLPGGFSGLYGELCDLETLGVCRRGYFVEGLGGAQFALPGAVERLRASGDHPEEAAPVVLAATDPAQPYGASLPWPERAADDPRARPARAAGAFVVLAGAEPVLYVERGGKSLQLLAADATDPRIEPALDALAVHVTGDRRRKLSIERVDGEPALTSPLAERLVAAGFRQGPRKLTLSA